MSMGLGLGLWSNQAAVSGGGGGGTWTPASLSTAAKAWYDADSLTGADASTVSTFTDKQGAFSATLSAGTGPVLRYAALNSRKVVEFTAASHAKMNISSTLLNGATQGAYFAVFELKNDPPLDGTTNGDAGAILDAFTSDAGGTQQSHIPYTDGIFYDHFGVSTRQTLGNPTPSFSSSYRLFNSEVTSGGTFTNYIDATQFFQAASQTVAFGAKTRLLGYSADNGVGVYFVNGYIAEVIVLDYAPTTSDRQKVEGYLAWRWGLQGNLPGGHPYKSAAP